jgi:hypothetical protein
MAAPAYGQPRHQGEVQVMKDKDNRISVAVLAQFATLRGFTVTEKDFSDLDGTLVLDITRNPACYEFEAVFRQLVPGGYWRWDHGVVHHETSADRIRTLRGLKDHLRSKEEES